MPQFKRELSVEQGFNFKKDIHDKVGFLTTLEVGGKKLETDLETIKQPTKPTDNIKVVAVLKSFSWDTGPTNPMEINGRISTANKQTLATLLLNDMVSATVKFQYVLYQFDPLENKYFKSSEHGKVLEGQISQDSSDLKLTVEDEAATEVGAPQNFEFNIIILPQSKEQEVTLATSDSMKVQKKWGIKSGK